MADKTVIEYNADQQEEILDFINENFGEGKHGMICHELNSDYVHTDVQVIDKDNQTILATFGMGARKMRIPVPQLKELQRAELVMFATADLNKEAGLAGMGRSMKAAAELQKISKYPFANDVWIGPGHTINASDGFAAEFGYDFFFFLNAADKPANVRGMSPVTFLQLIPIYKEERDWMASHPGTNAEQRVLDEYLDWAEEHDRWAEIDVPREVIIPN